jgi:hypothetical protein
MKYEIQHFTLCNGWVNTWTITDEEGNSTPEIFDNYANASVSLCEFLEEEKEAFENGFIESPYTEDEFRIVEVKP